MSDLQADVGITASRLAYEVSPIFFVNGIASDVPGKVLPIAAITESLSYVKGVLTGQKLIPSFNDYGCHFRVMPGATLIDARPADYPFANQTVAANAMLNQALRFSMWMVCPAKGQAGALLKTPMMTAIKAAFDKHQAQGGYYNVLTPAYLYTGCLLTGMIDVTQDSATGGGNNQRQSIFQLNFEKPLVTQEDATQLYNNLMGMIDSGSKTPAGLKLSDMIKSGVTSVNDYLTKFKSAIT